jgi:hypothetical protein
MLAILCSQRMIAIWTPVVDAISIFKIRRRQLATLSTVDITDYCQETSKRNYETRSTTGDIVHYMAFLIHLKVADDSSMHRRAACVCPYRGHENMFLLGRFGNLFLTFSYLYSSFCNIGKLLKILTWFSALVRWNVRILIIMKSGRRTRPKGSCIRSGRFHRLSYFYVIHFTEWFLDIKQVKYCDVHAVGNMAFVYKQLLRQPRNSKVWRCKQYGGRARGKHHVTQQ